MRPIDPTGGNPLGDTERMIVLCSDETCPHTPKHVPLPALFLGDANRSVLTRWELSDEERAAVAGGANLWIWHEGIRPGGFPPILPTFDSPLIGESCPDCRHRQPHIRRVYILTARYIGCPFCPCTSGWMPEEEKQ